MSQATVAHHRQHSLLVCAEPKRRNTAPPDMLEGAVEDMGIAPPGDALVCSGNPASHPASSATVPPSWDTALSMNSHQALTAVPNSHPYGFTVPEYQSLVLPARVERPMQPSLWVLPQFDGAGDQSSGDFSLLSQNGLTNLFAVDDDADSQQLVRDQGGLSQAHHPHMVFIFLAKMRALVARRRHQHGAVADSLALDGWRGRMWQRAVLARFARSEGITCFLATSHI